LPKEKIAYAVQLRPEARIAPLVITPLSRPSR